MGRPKVSFDDASLQTKRRRVQMDVNEKTEEELCLAAEMKLRVSGKRDAASMLSKIRFSPKRATRLKILESKFNSKDVSLSANEALAFYVSFKFTRSQYIGLRSLVSKKGLTKLFPTYDKIIEAKRECYPCNILATNLLAQVPVQDLLNHTTSRIIETQQEVITNFSETLFEPDIPLTMKYKWGSDGSGSQNRYKQKCEGDDSYILTTSVVPLQLSHTDLETENTTILWQNPRTSSTRFCRPIKIEFRKETDDVIKSEFSLIQNQIDQLTPTIVVKENKTYIISHELQQTMVDGKVCNSLMSVSSQKCYLCNAGPSQFNDLNYIKSLPVNPVAVNLGLSTLHAYIRFFEFLLHIAYRLKIKMWRVPKKHKEVYNQTKQTIIDKFRGETGLLVDMPKVGFGNTNDGNTARKFFVDPVLSSQITEVDENLIYRCGVILRTLNCNYKIDASRFGHYAYETAKIIIDLYPWYPMSPTVHKILMHSEEVINNFLLPIGMLGEDAQESQHKDIRYYREHNTRKISRYHTNLDLFNALLLSSDPVISQLRVLPPKKESIFNQDILDLLEAPKG